MTGYKLPFENIALACGWLSDRERAAEKVTVDAKGAEGKS